MSPALGRKTKESCYYVVRRLSKVRKGSTWHLPPNIAESKNQVAPKISVFQEPSQPGTTEPAKDMFRKLRPQVMVYKMARPVVTSTLWPDIRSGPVCNDDGSTDPDRLIVIVNAEDLRREGIELSRHLSWEKTCEDFVRELACNGQVVSLLQCAHLIVCFDSDGVIHHDRIKGRDTLYFSGSYAEGDYIKSCAKNSGDIPGLVTTFMAGFVSKIAEFDLSEPYAMDNCLHDGILNGLRCARRLCWHGFRSNLDGQPNMSWEYIMTGAEQYSNISIKPSTDNPGNDLGFEAITIPTDRVIQGLSWTALESIAGDPAEVAYRIVKDGPDILSRVPIARFGKKVEMVTADRGEIESYRAITNLIEEYATAKPRRTTPLCIGGFGPPGSGKSFALKRVAETALPDEDLPTLEFNLSQFRDYSELIVAFQLIRDTALSERLPIVLFDEFDANFNGKLGWLKYFLTPMNDGKFLDHGTTHPIGRAIFFFIGGTSPTLEAFKSDTNSEKGVTAKGPDFISRLSGYVNVRGVDPIPDQNSDPKYAIRRALILRELLRTYHLEGAIDDAVLNGILRVSRFKHGARSLSAILQMSRISGREKFERAALPSDDQLMLHVEPGDFLRLIRDPRLQWDLPIYTCPSADRLLAPNSSPLREAIAIRLHRLYCDGIKRIQEEKHHLLEGGIDVTTKEWNELEDMHKETSRAQADDIASKLRLIKCYFSRKDIGRTASFEFKTHQVEIFAQRDHERLVTLRLKNGWKYGKSRDIVSKVSPNLVDWSGLDPHFQDLYREIVKHIPQILRDYGFEIYPLVRGPQLVSH
ncbi:hypothetical protein DPV78_006080 [Talaromyces pinophilus]|nr:hypothetical protein DPV78_006080 [Talaromyces pinophilus]